MGESTGVIRRNVCQSYLMEWRVCVCVVNVCVCECVCVYVYVCVCVWGGEGQSYLMECRACGEPNRAAPAPPPETLPDAIEPRGDIEEAGGEPKGEADGIWPCV